jgi:predicted lipoprotein
VIGRALLAATVILWPLGASAQSEADYERLNRSLTEAVALPAIGGLAAATARLAQALEGFCSAPDSAARPEIDAAFATAMAAWQRVQPLDFGPLMADDGPARFQYWPDRRGTGARQLGRILAGEDASVRDPATLAEKSVALRDLQALERLLWDQDAPIEADPFRCAYAAAIARLQAGNAADLDAAWRGTGGFADLIFTAAAGNDAYYDAAEAARDYLDALSHGLERATSQKLLPVLGETPADARPRAAESWRSGLSTANLVANLETLQALLATEGGFADLAATGGDPLIGRTLAGMVADARERLQALPKSLELAVEDAVLRGELRVVADVMVRARSLAEASLAGAVGLTAGFNASDGD